MIGNIKDVILFYREHTRSDREYLDKLQEQLKSDLIFSRNDLLNKREVIEKCIGGTKKNSISDEFLVKKCNETFEQYNKLFKRLDKYTDEKNIKCKKFKDMNTIYNVIKDSSKVSAILQEYITQLRRYTQLK